MTPVKFKVGIFVFKEPYNIYFSPFFLRIANGNEKQENCNSMSSNDRYAALVVSGEPLPPKFWPMFVHFVIYCRGSPRLADEIQLTLHRTDK